MKLSTGNIEAAMARQDMSPADLARKTGWSEAKVSRLLNGKTKGVTLAILQELAAALGVSPAYICDLDDVAQTPEEREMLLKFRVAQERERQLADAILTPAKQD